MLTEKFNWPRNNANFKEIGNNTDILKLQNTKSIEEEFKLYSNYFLEAANRVTIYTLESNSNRYKDCWFFSIVYLYRQSLELLLKSIAFKYVQNHNKRIELIKNVKHNLKDCFDEINTYCKQNGLVLENKLFNWINNYLVDISTIDEQSDIFRYPFNIHMQEYFTEQTHINLKALAINMNTAYEILKELYNEKITNNVQLRYEPKLIISSGEYWEFSVIGNKFNHGSFEFYPFIIGYMETGNYLYQLIEGDINKKSLFLPMSYMYRNGIELALKRLIIDDCDLSIETAAKKIKNKKHSVQGLWNIINKYIIESDNVHDEDETLDYVGNYISQLHNIDHTSSKFRYPVNKELDFHFPKPEKLSIENFSLCFNELYSFLDAVDSMLTYYRDSHDYEQY
ncbi:hypothetical protein ACS2TZ_28070 [Bacillus cereus group sp. Bce025]|nr:hypothetical protein [Bacillus cereus]MDA2497334.1 hypothetical protein [Bacillus cereus]